MYRDIFGCYPDAEAKSYADLKRLKHLADSDLYPEKKKFIKGLAVEYPLEFLRDEDLRKTKSFEFGLFILPNYVFT